MFQYTTLQNLYSKLLQANKSMQFPKPPLSFAYLFQQTLHPRYKSRSPSFNSNSSQKNKLIILPSYSQINTLIQHHLQKRIINIGKIKQTGSILYEKINEDITKLQQNYKIIQQCNKIDDNLKKCRKLYNRLVNQLQESYEMIVGEQQFRNEGKFQQFVDKCYIPYCKTVNKQIIQEFKVIVGMVAPCIDLTSEQIPEQMPQFNYQIHHFKILEILQQLRSIVTTQYQQLISPINSQTSQQQNQTAILFIGKIKNILAQMNGILYNKTQQKFILNNIYGWINYHFYQELNKIKKQYVAIMGQSNKFVDEQYKMYRSQSIRYNGNVGDEQQINKINTFPNNLNKLNKSKQYQPSYQQTKQIYQPSPTIIHHYQSYLQILVYLILKQYHQNQFISTSYNQIVEFHEQLYKQLQNKNISLNKIRVKLDQIESKIIYNFNTIAIIKIVLYQQINDIAQQFIRQVQKIFGIIDEIKIFIGMCKVWKNIGLQVQQIDQICQVRGNNINQQQIVEICIRLYEHMGKYQQMYDYVTKSKQIIKKKQLIQIIQDRINKIKRLRLKINQPFLPTANFILDDRPNFNQTYKINLKHRLKQTQKLPSGRNSKILIQLQQSFSEQFRFDLDRQKTLTFNKSITKINMKTQFILQQKQQNSIQNLNDHDFNHSFDKDNIADTIVLFLQQTTQFFQHQFKNFISSGFQLAVFILDKGNQIRNDFKYVKLKTYVIRLLNQAASFNSNSLKKFVNSQNNTQPISSLHKQVQITIFNLTILLKTLSLTYTATNKSIIHLTDECLNFQYQDWTTQIKIYEQNIKIFDKTCKQIQNLSSNNTTSMFSIVYKVIKEYSNIMQVSCDIFYQILYIFKNCKQLQQQHKGKLANTPIDILNQEDLNYITTLLSYKMKIKDEIAQLEKFNNLHKSARVYLKSIYIKFQNNFNTSVQYSQEILTNLINISQICIGFKQNHRQIFYTFEEIINRQYKSKEDVKQMWEIANEIVQLDLQIKQVLKLGQSLPINMYSLEQIKKLYLMCKQQFVLAKIAKQIFMGRANLSQVKFSDKKQKDLLQKVIAANKFFHQ